MTNITLMCDTAGLADCSQNATRDTTVVTSGPLFFTFYVTIPVRTNKDWVLSLN
jgi:hypothetical protein